MATPQKVTPAQIKEEIKDHKEEWLKAMDTRHPLYPIAPKIFESVYLHGRWMEKKLREQEVDGEGIEMICMALGQRMFGNEPSSVTALVWNRWVEGYVDKTGLELGKELYEEYTLNKVLQKVKEIPQDISLEKEKEIFDELDEICGNK